MAANVARCVSSSFALTKIDGSGRSTTGMSFARSATSRNALDVRKNAAGRAFPTRFGLTKEVALWTRSSNAQSDCWRIFD